MKVSQKTFLKLTSRFSYLTGKSQNLAAVFNSKPARISAFSMRNNKQGLFRVPELSSPEGFYILQDRVIADSNKLVEESISHNRNRKMVEIFDELSDTLCRLADLAEFIRIAHPDRKFAAAAEQACVSINALVERLNTHVELYSSLKYATETRDVLPLSQVDEHVGKLFLFDFEQSGIHLPEEIRKKTVALNDRILQLGQRFSYGTQEPRRILKEKLPSAVQQHFSADRDHLVISSLHAETSNEVIREAAYKMYLHPDRDQGQVLDQILSDRYELANLCGFSTFSDRALKNSVAGSPDLVHDFLNKLKVELSSRAASDYNIMRDLKKKQMSVRNDLYPWDPPYLTGVMKREIQAVRSSDLAPFFSIGNCMEGLNHLFQSLYDISLESCETENGEVWHSDVHKLAVVHSTEGLLGYIYCDFFEREGKPHQDCHFTIVGGRTLSDGSYQNPIVVLMLNLPAPSWGTPSLLTPGMVENLFHEMGHAMHSMLARTSYQHVTGTRCSTDLAEVPSVLMEFFASDPRILCNIAKHYKTGAALPEATLNAVCAAKHAFTASESQLQVFYAALDQKYHGEYPLGASTTDVLANIQSEYYGLPYVPNTAWQLRFGHLFGYGAKYYSYLMSRSVASWLWHDLFSQDPLSRDSGEKYRAGVLAHGGGMPPREILGAFLKQEVSADNLANSLISEIDDRREKLKEVWR